MWSCFLPNQFATISADAGPQVHSVTCCVVWKLCSITSVSLLFALYQSKKL